MNCGSCVHISECEYQEFKKLMEYHIYDNELEDILNVVCENYKNRNCEENIILKEITMKFRNRDDKIDICKEIRKDMRDRLSEQGIYCYDKMPTLIDIAFIIDSYEKNIENKQLKQEDWHV